jgi:hypothetical protein
MLRKQINKFVLYHTHTVLLIVKKTVTSKNVNSLDLFDLKGAKVRW